MTTWFNRLRNWQSDAANAIGIRADYHDSEDDNFAAGINNSLNIAGGNSPTANISMGGFGLTGMLDGASLQAAATVSQIIKTAPNYAVDSGTAMAFVVTLPISPGAYTAGLSIMFKVNETISYATSVTINVNGLGAKNIYYGNTSALGNAVSVNFFNGGIYNVVYDGTNFQLVSTPADIITAGCRQLWGGTAVTSGLDYVISIYPPDTNDGGNNFISGKIVNFIADVTSAAGGPNRLKITNGSLTPHTIVRNNMVNIEPGDLLAGGLYQVVGYNNGAQSYWVLNSPNANTVSSYALQKGTYTYGTASSGGTATFVTTITPAPTAYVEGMRFSIKFSSASVAGTNTLNVNGLGAKNITKALNKPLDLGDIGTNQIIELVYDNSEFQIVSGLNNALTMSLTQIYGVDSAGTDTYAMNTIDQPTVIPFTAGLMWQFKAGTLNTGPCTLNVWSTGAKPIKKNVNQDLDTGDILAGQIVQVIYDGTNYQLASPPSGTLTQQSQANYAADAQATDTYVITLAPAPSVLTEGLCLNFKANTLNTGACTINVNGLGAKSIVKNSNQVLDTGDILAGQINQIVYDGTNFQLTSGLSGTVNQSGSAIFAADGQASDTYVITLAPAPSTYSVGGIINFKANTLNTGTCTLNVNGLGAKTIVKNNNQVLDTGDILANQMVQVIYDGSNNLQMVSPPSGTVTQQGQAIFAADAQASDTYVITLAPVPSVLSTGMMINFKANTLNTGACTLNVNSLGAKTIKKNNAQDLDTGDIVAGQMNTVIYDGTNFQLTSQLASTVNQAGSAIYVADTGSANAYVTTLVPAATAYTTGMVVRFKAVNANTTASTLNVNGLGVKNITKKNAVALVANDIVASQTCEVIYDGTQFQLMSNLTVAALKADQTTATSVNAYVTPAIQQNHPSAVKWAVQYTSITTTAILGTCYNHTSLVDGGVGITTFTMTVAMTSINFAVAAVNTGGFTSAVAASASTVTINTYNTASTLTDQSYISGMAQGTQ